MDLAVEKVIGLAHRSEDLEGLEDRDGGGEIPEGADVEVGKEDEKEEDGEGEEKDRESSGWSKRARRETANMRL